MRKRILFVALALLLSLSGCSLRLPMLPEVRNVEVTTVVKSKPLSIGAEGSTSISTDSFTPEAGKKIDPATGEVIDGGAGDSLLGYSVSGVEVPSNLSEALDLDVEALYFSADLPLGVGGGLAAVTLSAPGGSSVVLVTSLENGENKLTLSAEDRAALSQILANAASVNVDIWLDSELDGVTIADLQVQAAAIYSQNV
ncbi:MAG: hypothetical protein ACOX4G_08245 [Limnochordia bacterium]